MIYNPDTSLQQCRYIRRINVRTHGILSRNDDKGVGGIHRLAPCPLEFEDRNIYGRTLGTYVQYVYYAHTRRYVHIRTTVLHPYL